MKDQTKERIKGELNKHLVDRLEYHRAEAEAYAEYIYNNTPAKNNRQEWQVFCILASLHAIATDRVNADKAAEEERKRQIIQDDRIRPNIEFNITPDVDPHAFAEAVKEAE